MSHPHILRISFGIIAWQTEPRALELLAQLSPPGEQLRRGQAMTPRHRADRLQPGIALRDNRGLHLQRPGPPLACPREHLKPLNTLGASIIT